VTLDTATLIRHLSSDVTAGRERPHALWLRLAVMTALAAMLSLAAILLLTRSPHLAHGPTPTIVFTALAGALLAVGAFRATLQLGYPENRVSLLWTAAPVAVLMSGLALEMSQTPSSTWPNRLWGGNPLACFSFVVALSLPILAAALLAMRAGAPTRPRLAGAMAGLLAGGIATALYTIHCPENSLFFVASWHVMAVLAVAACGAFVARRCLHW
jgi:hypothetical protein